MDRSGRPVEVPKAFLLRYGEIGIKSAIVRRRFEERLEQNLLAMVEQRGGRGTIEREWGRLLFRCDDPLVARSVLSQLFGVVSFSPVIELPEELEPLAEGVASRVAPEMTPQTTFAVRVRRTGDQSYTSVDAASRIGAAIAKRAPAGVRVDLAHPTTEVHVEIRKGRAYLATEIVPGPGGLPLGSEGRAVAIVGDERGAVAAWLAMRRGCAVDAVALSPEGRSWANRLSRFAQHLAIHDATTSDGLADACRVAIAIDARAIVVGHGIDEALSAAPTTPPLFSPLVGFSQDAVSVIAARIASREAPAIESPAVRGGSS